MSKDELRPVEYRKDGFFRNDEPNAQKGWFHKWHTTKFENGDEETSAIIETADGSMIRVSYSSIKFKDR